MIINGRVIPVHGNTRGLNVRGKLVFIGADEIRNCCHIFFDELASSIKDRGGILKTIDKSYTEFDYRRRGGDPELLDLLDHSRGKAT